MTGRLVDAQSKDGPSPSSKSAESAAKMASEILAAYLPHASVAPADLPALIRAVRRALEGPIDAIDAVVYPNWGDGTRRSDRVGDEQRGTEGAQKQRPAVPIADSVHDGYLINLEDGKRYRSLRRHLMVKYGMTPEQYREKWGLPDTYPMVAPSYARERSEVAKRIGLGRTDDAEMRRAPGSSPVKV
jgi:predicted transcriptional regulator